MNELKNVDGTGSGLDADLLDGKHATDFAASTHNHDTAYVKKTGDTMTGNLTVNSTNVTAGSGTDGSGKTFVQGKVQAGAKAGLFTNAEGGNLSLESPGGIRYELDCYNGNLRIVCFTADGKAHTITLVDGTTGAWKG